MKYFCTLLIIINIVLMTLLYKPHQQNIRWTNYVATFIIDGKKISIITGLRNDGVLVWKENKITNFEY